MFENVFKDELIWHRFDVRMTDEEVAEALAALGLVPEMVDRDQQVVWIKGRNELSPEIQNVLNNWQPCQ